MEIGRTLMQVYRQRGAHELDNSGLGQHCLAQLTSTSRLVQLCRAATCLPLWSACALLKATSLRVCPRPLSTFGASAAIPVTGTLVGAVWLYHQIHSYPVWLSTTPAWQHRYQLRVLFGTARGASSRPQAGRAVLPMAANFRDKAGHGQYPRPR